MSEYAWVDEHGLADMTDANGFMGVTGNCQYGLIFLDEIANGVAAYMFAAGYVNNRVRRRLMRYKNKMAI